MSAKKSGSWVGAVVLTAACALSASLWAQFPRLPPGVQLPPGLQIPGLPTTQSSEPLEIEVDWEWNGKFINTAVANLSCGGSPTVRARFRGEMQPQLSAPGTWSFRVDDGAAFGTVGSWRCKDTKDPAAKPSGIRSQAGGTGKFVAFAMFGAPGAAALATGLVPANLAAAAALNISALGGSASFDVLTEPDGERGGEGTGFAVSSRDENVQDLLGAGLITLANIDEGVNLQSSPPFTLTSADFENAKGFVKTFRFSKSGVLRGGGDPTSFGIMDDIRGTLTLRYKQPRTEVSLDGCFDVAKGASSKVTAVGKPAGGSYRWWAEPEGIISIKPQAASAALHGEKFGKTTIHVEYTAPGGGKKETSREATSAEVISINDASPIPKLGLYDADGKPTNPPRTVRVKIEPAGDTHLSFAADPAIVTAVNHGDSLELQGLRVGITTVQAQSSCSGGKTGPAVNVEVVRCDDDVIAELQKRIGDVERQISDIQAEGQKIASDPKVQQAIDDAVQSLQDAVFSAAKALTFPASGTAAVIKDGLSVVKSMMKNDFQSGYTTAARRGFKEDLKNYSGSPKGQERARGVDKFYSVVKDLDAAVKSLNKYSDNMDVVDDALGRLKRLIEEKAVLDDRLATLNNRLAFCKQGGAEPPSPGQPASSGQPGSTPQRSGQAGSTPQGAAQPGSSQQSGTAGQGSTAQGGTGQAGQGGAPGGGSTTGGTTGRYQIPSLAKCQEPAKQLGRQDVVSFGNRVKRTESLLEDISKSTGIPDQQRLETLAAGLSAEEDAISETEKLSGRFTAVTDNSKSCEQQLGAAKQAFNVAGSQLKWKEPR